jgi:hypothetical protein
MIKGMKGAKAFEKAEVGADRFFARFIDAPRANA